MLVVVRLELQVFHEISWIYQNSQDSLENSLNPKLIPKFPRSWENSQAVAALLSLGITMHVRGVRVYLTVDLGYRPTHGHGYIGLPDPTRIRG